MQKPVFFSNFEPFFMETTVNISNLSSFTERFSRIWCSLPWLIRRTKQKPQRIVQQAMIKLWILLQENEGALEGARTFFMDICIINKLLFLYM